MSERTIMKSRDDVFELLFSRGKEVSVKVAMQRKTDTNEFEFILYGQRCMFA